MRNINKIERIDALNYEVYSSWWCGYVSNKFLQNIISKYFARKVNRKYNRYIKNLEFIEKIKQLQV